MNPCLAAIDGPLKGQVYELDSEPLTLGRAAGNRIRTDDQSSSRQHCVIEEDNGIYRVRDLSSHNGTFVNGVPVMERLLSEGDEIRVGRSVFRFLLNDSTPTSAGDSVRLAPGSASDATMMLLRPDRSLYLPPGQAVAATTPAVPATGYRALLRIAGALHAREGVEALARAMLEALFEAVPAERGAALLWEGDEAAPAAARCRTPESGAVVDVDRRIIERVRRDGVAVLSGAGGARSVIAAPLAGRGQPLGVLYLDRAAEGGAGFAQDELQLATAAALLAGPAFEDARELARLERENHRLQQEILLRHEMVGDSAAMREIYRVIERVAAADSTVLILGETGTGKELAARAIHQNSARGRRAFVAVNSAALTESLLESELFGHEKGAFTGAVARKLGKLELADGGTLFLDEIGELPLALQAKLLRVLQERVFERVGGTQPIHVDIRLLAATNRDLLDEVKAGRFRQDLFYRLNVVKLRLPALRERREDIPLLANYFLAQTAKRTPRAISGFTDEARACLAEYDWPGNVRELQNAIESAVVLGFGERIAPEDLPDMVRESAPAGADDPDSFLGAMRQRKSEVIVETILQAGGNITEAARRLKINPNSLHRLIRNLGLRDAIQKPAR